MDTPAKSCSTAAVPSPEARECAGAGFCINRATVVTLAGLLIWLGLSRASFLVPEEPWAEALKGGFAKAHLLAVGLLPWVGIVFLFQLLAAGSRMLSDWVCARTCEERAEVYRWLFVLAGLAFLAAVNEKVAWAHTMALHGKDGHPLVPVPGPDIFAALVLGAMGAAAVVLALQKVGPGFGFTLAAVFAIVAWVGPRLAPYATWLRAHWFIGPLQLALMAATGCAVVWLVNMTYEAPADLTPGGRDAPPIQVPVLVVGVLPLCLSEIAIRVLRGAVRGLSFEFELYGRVSEASAALLAPNGWLTAIVQLGLVWILTSVAFSILYPGHRLEQIFGLSRERIDESLESFLDGLMIQNALILSAVFLVSRLASSTFEQLGLTAATFLTVVGGLAALRKNLLYRRALEEKSGGLLNAKTVLGQLEGEIARAKLAAAGIPSYLHAWTVQQIHPVSVSGMGEVDVLVPHRVVDEARKLLA
jgi:preprotein translocase subunit SecY